MAGEFTKQKYNDAQVLIAECCDEAREMGYEDCIPETNLNDATPFSDPPLVIAYMEGRKMRLAEEKSERA